MSILMHICDLLSRRWFSLSQTCSREWVLLAQAALEGVRSHTPVVTLVISNV